jgi:4-hydroxy-2-oxoheptanedioate aldolase
MLPNLLKRRLLAGETLFGAWISTGSATNAEILGHAGFDFLVLDLEHGAGDLRDATEMLRAAERAGTAPVLRVPSHDAAFLKRVLDRGARSIMVPQVENAADARALVAACRYPPAGRRGYGVPGARASDYGFDAEYTERANDELLLVIQIESADAVREAAAICAVDGVDVAFIGVNDLAGSIGLLEQLDRPELRALVAEAEAAIRGAGKPLGTVPSAGASWSDLARAGYGMIAHTSDVALLREGARTLVAAGRRLRGEPEAPPARPSDY